MISIKDVDVKELLGVGITSQVYRCIFQEKQYALKVFKSDVSKVYREKEIEALSHLKHENIIPLQKFDQNKEWIMTELLDKRDLFDLISIANAPFEESIARNVFKKLASALEYIHSEGYAHRDIKLENILVCPETFTIKLGDFGFTEKITHNTEVMRYLGTKGYQAPELQLQTIYQTSNSNQINTSQLTKSDVFALGVVMFILVLGHPPFFSTKRSDGCSYWRVCASKKWQVFWNAVQKNKDFQISEEFKRLFEQMIEPDISQRIDLKDVLNSEWLKKEIANDNIYKAEIERRLKLNRET